MSVAGKKVSDFPQLNDEWCAERNVGLSPHVVAAGSNKKVWWQCRDGHEFFASPNGRTNNRRDSSGVSPCPYCGGLKFWTWEKIVSVAREIVEREGHLPSAGKLQATGHAMLVQYLYKHGRSWGDLRQAAASFQTASFVPSRNGLRWRSHPEASLSNFLFARGIRHEKGRKYPEDYAEFADKMYGYYDLHFFDVTGRLIDVEIWGDKPHGHGEDAYARVRSKKEDYNNGRTNFLGIHYTDCLNDKKLTEILRPYIGVIDPYVFQKPHDPYIETTHWSNADELLKTCHQIAAQQPDGKFPAEDWLRKRGKWAQRQGPAYNTVSIYVKLWLGGIRKTRELLGQSHESTRAWTKNSVVESYRKFYLEHGMTTEQARHLYRREKSAVTESIAKEAANISHAIQTYAGGIAIVNQQLGIVPVRSRNWSREAVLKGFKAVMDKWNLSPHHLRNDHKTGKLQLDQEFYRHLGQLVDAAPRYFKNSTEIFALIGFTPPSRPRKRRSKNYVR
jgi:Probable Zinc-ribbon domain